MRATKGLFALGAVAVAALVAASPFGCFYPDYTFDKNVSGGGGSGASTQHGPGGSMSNTGGSITGMGGAGAGGMTSSSTGIGGTPCGTDGRCIADVPSGWTGYFALYDGVATLPDPGCPSEYPSDTTPPYLGQGDFNDGGDGSCQCTCKTPSGEVCNYPTEVDVQPATCANAQCGYILQIPPSWNGSCAGMDYVPKDMCANDSTCMGTARCSGSITVPPATVDESGASCQPNAVKLVKTDATFGTLGRACGDPQPMGGSCNGGQSCLPAPPSPFVGICIMQTGDVMCPPIFTKKHIFYDNSMDDRACSGSCSCPDPPTGASCTAHIKLWQDLQIGICSTQVGSTDFVSGACTDLPANLDVNVAGRTGTLTAPTGGSCAGDNSATTAMGSANPVGPTTFCCVQ